MPYVNETKSKVEVFYPLVGSGSGSRLSTPMTCKRHTAAQYGWRSKGEVEAANAALKESEGAQWADTINLIAAYDRLERAMSNPSVRPEDLPVHERRYTVEDKTSANPYCEIYPTKGLALWQRAQPNLYNSLTIDTPYFPSDADIRTVGGNLIRESRPAKPQANLSQWFGELRQFGDMFNVPHELPPELHKHRNSSIDELRRFGSGGQAVGKGYLAGQFGWLPFIGEVINSLDNIAKSGPLLDDFVLNAAKIHRRTNSKITYQNTATASTVVLGAGNATTPYGSSFSSMGLTIGTNVQKSIGSDAFRFKALTTVTRVDSYRTSSLFEYFVADPAGFAGAVQKRAQEAKYLLGDPLISLGTFWELTPWSWAVDWSFNLGGLLSFQESVATDGLVCRRNSAIFESRITVATHWTPYYEAPQGFVKTSGNLISTLDYRYQRRLAGSPYDMGIDWSGFSPQKWFILGALGLTKAPGVKP